MIKSTHNLLGLKNMIGLVQQINKISHPRGNFAHGQFSVLVGDLHTSVCLLRWWMGEDGRAGGWREWGPRYFVDHINSGGDTGHPSWPDRLSPLACTWTGPTSGSNFPFSFVDHLTMCFPRLGQMSSHSWSTSGLRTPCKALLRCLRLPATTECRAQFARQCLRDEHEHGTAQKQIHRKEMQWTAINRWNSCKTVMVRISDKSGVREQKRHFSLISNEPPLGRALAADFGNSVLSLSALYWTFDSTPYEALVTFVSVHARPSSSSGFAVVVAVKAT